MIGIIFTNLASTGAPHDILGWSHAAKYFRLSYFAFNRFSPQWVLGSCHGRTAEMIEKWARPGQNISEIGLGNWVSPMAMETPIFINFWISMKLWISINNTDMIHYLFCLVVWNMNLIFIVGMIRSNLTFTFFEGVACIPPTRQYIYNIIPIFYGYSH